MLTVVPDAVIQLFPGQDAQLQQAVLQAHQPALVVGGSYILRRVELLQGVAGGVAAGKQGDHPRHLHAEEAPFPRFVKDRLVLLPPHRAEAVHAAHVVDAVHGAQYNRIIPGSGNDRGVERRSRPGGAAGIVRPFRAKAGAHRYGMATAILPKFSLPKCFLPFNVKNGSPAQAGPHTWTTRSGAMIRRRLYNPAQLTPGELKASFVAREETLGELLRVIGGQMPGRPCQHMMLISPRGMGKTTLGLRFLYAVEDDPNLAAQWQPVAFHEESYGIGNLAEFWLAALHHLTRATGDPRWADRADSLAEDEEDTERLAAYALAALLDFNEASGKRLILFVENLDAILAQLRNEREIHALRASLIERQEILLLGSANAVFEAIRGYGQPFYEFFRLFTLEGLEPADARRMLEAVAQSEGKPEIPETLDREHGRLETIRRLTGGNPRLLVLSCRILIESPLGPAIEDLEQLIDEQTPYFKARIEDLPIQARKVFHCLSEGWKPMLAKEVAVAAKLGSSHTSAQLKQLLEKGYVQVVRLPGGKRARYEVSDRFYNIYYLLRFSRAGRDRLERLVAFLHDLFGQAGMRTMYPAALAALRADGVGTRALSGDWTEALDQLEHALRIAGNESQEHELPGLTESLIRAVAAGHGRRVKEMMDAAGLAESMEPLWHAIRAELGEELEPLPAEIMMAVTEIRQRFSATNPGSQP